MLICGLTWSAANLSKAIHHIKESFDTQIEYKVRDIIGETKTKYHVDWAPDEVTGETYEPTWEPKSYVNQLAIDAWLKKKAKKKAGELPRLLFADVPGV